MNTQKIEVVGIIEAYEKYFHGNKTAMAEHLEVERCTLAKLIDKANAGLEIFLQVQRLGNGGNGRIQFLEIMNGINRQINKTERPREMSYRARQNLELIQIYLSDGMTIGEAAKKMASRSSSSTYWKRRISDLIFRGEVQIR